MSRVNALMNVSLFGFVALSAAVSPREGANRAYIAALEHRIEVLESERGNAQIGNTVKGTFTVVDAENRPVFQVDAAGHSWRLFAENGQPKAYSFALNHTGSLAVIGLNEHLARLQASEKYALLELHDGPDLARARVGVTQNGAEVTVLDPAHKEVAKLSDVQGGGGRLEVNTADQHRAATLRADRSAATMALRDGPGADRVAASLGPDGTASLSVLSPAHKPSAQLKHGDAGGQLDLNSAEGKPFIAAQAGKAGGRLEMRNDGATRIAVMEAYRGGARFAVSDGADSAKTRAAIGVAEDGKTEFRVFNQTHGKILEVAQEDSGGGRLHLYDPAGNSNVTLGAMHFGGYFRAQTPDGNRVAILGTEPGNALVTLRDGSKTSRLTMVVGRTGKPELALFNTGHKDIVSLTESNSGAGILQLFDANGTTMVEAGTNADGKGTVHAGPLYKCVPISGVLPVLADCIVGHKQP